MRKKPYFFAMDGYQLKFFEKEAYLRKAYLTYLLTLRKKHTYFFAMDGYQLKFSLAQIPPLNLFTSMIKLHAFYSSDLPPLLFKGGKYT